jgi:HPt (histidine-containing phosphotransfer) domain-containing protein
LIKPKRHSHPWKRPCTSLPIDSQSVTDDNRKEKNLEELSSLGHFLKGSSAALGIVAVQDACEKMQHYGHLRDEEENTDLKEEDALNRIEGLIKGCRKDYEQAKVWLTSLYTEGAFDVPKDQEEGEDDE